MSEQVRVDPYLGIAIVGEQDFALLAKESVTPLHFETGPAFIVRTVLAQEDKFTARTIAGTHGFREAFDGSNQLAHLKIVFAKICFTFTALNSDLILPLGHQPGESNVYMLNPNYEVVDKT